MFSAEVKVKALPVREWLDRYCFPGRFLDACRACPDYGRVWSCPPGVPEAEALLGAYRTVYLVGVKVRYSQAALARALRSPEETEAVRQETYGVAKRALLESLLALERLCPGSTTVRSVVRLSVADRALSDFSMMHSTPSASRRRR